jgi:hypothetical protein
VTCDFDEVSNIGAEEFLIDYLSVQRPVIVKDALQSPGWQKLIPKWSRESILKEMGDVEVSSGSIPYAHNFGLEVRCQLRTKGAHEAHAERLQAASRNKPRSFVLQCVGEPDDAVEFYRRDG